MSKTSALQVTPPRAEIRARKMQVALTVEEHDQLTALAADRGEPTATVARALIVAALRALKGQ